MLTMQNFRWQFSPSLEENPRDILHIPYDALFVDSFLSLACCNEQDELMGNLF